MRHLETKMVQILPNKRVNDIAVQKKKLCKIGESPNIATVESGAKDPGSWQWYMYICIRDID